MTLMLEIDVITQRVLEEAFEGNLERAALEALAIEGYRQAKPSTYQVQKLPGFEDRWQTQRWLGERGAHLNYDIDGLEADRAALDRLLGRERR
jgi:hypothetical protein